ncbi:MAG: chromosomal replication initiator protein DnaA, partial [Candidatus Omnitrophica bacterium]|nr:chromosomal replication initiator protein DnaA [Candidatus Omnitrophota bacterium]
MNLKAEELKPVWTKTLVYIKDRVSEQVFAAWFEPITPISADENNFKLGVPSDFFKEWVTEKYFDLIKSCLALSAGEEMLPIFTTIEEKESEEKKIQAGPQKAKPGILSSIFPRYTKDHQARQIGLNPKYTFEAFVVGPNNRFAHAASLAISESPAKTYNPLFIYGGVGLGKTHLMHSIGNFVSSKSPKTKILYISSEEFTNQLISAIQTRTTPEFRKKYRLVDVLMIDDIHFIAGKEATQEEFFHTFNALYDAHKQIIMSSDRSPKEIPTLEERLVSRFGWGLVTDVQPPDFETRVAILKKKSERETVPVPNDVLYFLGENIKTNIRELEG